jgi:hypothetical protein
LKNAHSTSAATIPEASTLNEPLGNPKDAINDVPQDPPQEKISDQNNESSNSCLQPPSIKVFLRIPFFLYLGMF